MALAHFDIRAEHQRIRRLLLADVERARDEIRLKIHLGGMDAKSEWDDLERRLPLLEERANREGRHIAEATRALAKELRRFLEDFKKRL